MRIALAAIVVVGHCDLRLISPAVVAAAGFLALSVGFAMSPTARARPAARCVQLIFVWLAWSAIYAALRTAKCASEGDALLGWCEPWMLVTGPSVHLWFLPTLALTLLAATILGDRARSRRFGLLLVALGAAAAWIAIRPTVGSAKPWPQVLLATALIPTSIGWSAILSATPSRWLALPAALLLAAAIVLPMAGTPSAISVLAAIPATVVLARVEQPGAAVPLVAVASLTPGIYFSHIAAIIGLGAVGMKGLAAAPAALALSAAAAFIGRRTPLRPIF